MIAPNALLKNWFRLLILKGIMHLVWVLMNNHIIQCAMVEKYTVIWSQASLTVNTNISTETRGKIKSLYGLRLTLYYCNRE